MKIERVQVTLPNVEQLLQNMQKSQSLSSLPTTLSPEQQQQGVDTVDISEGAKTAYGLLRIAKAVASVPYIRWEKIKAAKEALEKGLYLFRKVTEIVAERIRERIVGYNIWTENDDKVYNLNSKDILAKRIATLLIPLSQQSFFSRPLYSLL
jgi:hypothetical protein